VVTWAQAILPFGIRSELQNSLKLTIGHKRRFSRYLREAVAHLLDFLRAW
jgi:hypothetical protein